MSIARRIGEAIGRALEPLIGARVRAAYATKYGVCERCAAPLSGESPSRRCEACRAAEVLAAGLGGAGGADA